MRVRVVAMVFMVVAAGCGDSSVTVSSTEPDTTTPTTAIVPTEGGAPCVEGPGGFFGDGPLGSQVRDGADAATVTGITLRRYEECEQLIIELAAASGAPATSLGSTSAELIRPSGVVRVHLDPTVSGTTLSDVVFDASFADRVYVVRDLDESLFVDVHLAAATVARFSEAANPVRLVVDLAPGGSVVGASESSDFVVVMPLPDQLSRPVVIDGYGRTFEASVIVRARQGERIISESFTTSADYLETWGRFELALPPEVVGAVELFIGEDSARDGEEQGVYLEVIVDE